MSVVSSTTYGKENYLEQGNKSITFSTSVIPGFSISNRAIADTVEVPKMMTIPIKK